MNLDKTSRKFAKTLIFRSIRRSNDKSEIAQDDFAFHKIDSSEDIF
jgi:hypothetical protein